MSLQKLVRITCDDCLDAEVLVAGASATVAVRAARSRGWQVRKRERDAWLGPAYVCDRCIDYGRPYAVEAVPARSPLARPAVSSR